MTNPEVPIRIDRHNATGIIRLNRPAVHNAIDEATMDALQAAVAEFNADAAVRSVLLTAAGNQTFCAGGDLHYFSRLTTREAGKAMSRKMQSILMQMEEAPKPYIAAITGNAFGGGCELALACHIRIMAEGAYFAFRQGANGIITGWGGGRRLFRMVNPSTALEWLLTARRIPADELTQHGIVQRMVPVEEVEVFSLKLADQIHQLPESAVQAFLALYRLAMNHDWEGFATVETEKFADLWMSPVFRQFLQRWSNSR